MLYSTYFNSKNIVHRVAVAHVAILTNVSKFVNFGYLSVTLVDAGVFYFTKRRIGVILLAYPKKWELSLNNFDR
jgi:hypothetical protein